MKREIDFKVNGETYSIVVDTRETLLDALRYRLGFMGPKEGCGNGNCGSCTVALNGMIVDSCLVFAVEAEGAEVTTVEGVAVDGKLHPVQQAFIENGALQCSVDSAHRVSSCRPRHCWNRTLTPPSRRSV